MLPVRHRIQFRLILAYLAVQALDRHAPPSVGEIVYACLCRFACVCECVQCQWRQWALVCVCGLCQSGRCTRPRKTRRAASTRRTREKALTLSYAHENTPTNGWCVWCAELFTCRPVHQRKFRQLMNFVVIYTRRDFHGLFVTIRIRNVLILITIPRLRTRRKYVHQVVMSLMRFPFDLFP